MAPVTAITELAKRTSARPTLAAEHRRPLRHTEQRLCGDAERERGDSRQCQRRSKRALRRGGRVARAAGSGGLPIQDALAAAAILERAARDGGVPTIAL